MRSNFLFKFIFCSAQKSLVRGIQLRNSHILHSYIGVTQKRMTSAVSITNTATKHTQMSRTFLRRSQGPKETYGKSAYDKRNPKIKPNMWAQLSTHGKRPIKKRTKVTATKRSKARQGYRISGQQLITSTKRQANRPNCEPEGPTSARYGTNIAEAKFPAIPDTIYIIPMRTGPANFSRSRIK